jgi:hypothetical protein
MPRRDTVLRGNALSYGRVGKADLAALWRNFLVLLPVILHSGNLVMVAALAKTLAPQFPTIQNSFCVLF